MLGPLVRIQTHLSENEGEISFTKKLFPFAKSYTHVYDHYALLGPRTILAHAIHLDDDEMELIRKKRCGVSHCPTSNFNLRSGTSRVGEMLNKGIKVGLGTDVSGGFGLSMLTAIREASVVAKVLALATSNRGIAGDGTNLEGTELNLSKTLAEEDKVIDGRYPLPAVDGKFRPRPPAIIQSPTETNTHGNAQSTDFTAGPLSIATLYYLATLGGAEVCSMAHKIGSLAPGKVSRGSLAD